MGAAIQRSRPLQHIHSLLVLLFVVLFLTRSLLPTRDTLRPTRAGQPVLCVVLLALLGLPCFSVPSLAQTVEGHVTFDGPQPRLRAIRMSADPNCEALHEDRVFANDRVIAEDGSLADVFVYVESPPAGSYEEPPPTESVELRQQGCIYLPRVQGIRLRQTLEVVNDDPTLHNVRSLAEVNRPFNLGQPEGGRRTKFFTKVETPVRFKCDVHPWMFAFLFVMDHPFFDTTGTDGKFRIEGLPAGRHTLVAWHEIYGELRLPIEVSSGQTATANFVFLPE